MRIMIDTNILISSILGSDTTFQAYKKAVSYPNRGILYDAVSRNDLRQLNLQFAI